MRIALCSICLALLAPLTCDAASLSILIDDKAARAVLQAVQDPALTRDQALTVARLPGNEGLIEKLHSYHKAATEEMLADALIDAARHQPSPTEDGYQFAKVRDNAAAVAKTLDALTDPSTGLIDGVKTRIAQFAPERLKGRLIGYLIAGGTSGGFAFGKPEFFLNLYRFPSPLIAQTILEHELYHGVQSLARSSRSFTAAKACLGKTSGGGHMFDFLSDLYDEGTASYVGDVLSIPEDADSTIEENRKHFAINVMRVKRSVTLLELSVHAIATSKIDYESIYNLGFYDDEILYALGYVMTKSIVAERGSSSVADLLGKPASQFIAEYVALPGYGKTDEEPKLGDETIQWAKKVATCGG